MRPLRENFPGTVHHVATRGNDRERVLVDDLMRMTFMRMFARIAVKYSWVIYAWCLMTTHYHVVLRIPVGGIRRGCGI